MPVTGTGQNMASGYWTFTLTRLPEVHFAVSGAGLQSTSSQQVTSIVRLEGSSPITVWVTRPVMPGDNNPCYQLALPVKESQPDVLPKTNRPHAKSGATR